MSTSAKYDAAGEMTSSTDGAGNTTSYGYDLDGHQVKATLPDGSATAAGYDLAGRQTSVSDLDTTGAVLRTESSIYNPTGTTASATDFRGNKSTFSYDATGMLVSATQPVSATQSITVGYGYDLAGHRTALTDGNNNTTYTTYNSLGLPERITEPSTAQHSTAADSQTLNGYDGDGNLLTQVQPGGVTVTSTFDVNGKLSGQSGTGASALTASRTFTYDQAGRLKTATTTAAGTAGSFGYQPATSESFNWEDRGLLLSSSGTAGSTSYNWISDGQQSSVTDAAGTSGFTYDSAGRLATDADAASGVTGTYSYNTLDQVSKVTYGTGNDVQSFGYDSLHRLASDAVTTASSAAVASIGYGYDSNNNVTSVTTAGLAVSGGGTGTVTNTYGYDQANRLTSWTATPSGGTAVTRSYGYDGNGNLTNNNGVTQVYDARNELTTDGTNTYSYTANGDLAQQDSPGNAVYAFTSDAYGQQVTDGFSSFAWDGLDRVVSAGEAFNPGYSVALTYDGLGRDVASDPSATYSRDPAGQITGVDSVSGGRALALVDEHTDLSGTFASAGASLASSSTWDPWGQLLASTGPVVQVGFQGQWADPVTGQVNMGSRMYRAPVGGFINQDTYTGGEGGAAVSDNLHAYAGDNPLTVTDPTGHVNQITGGGGPLVTAADVNAEGARAAAAAQQAAQLARQAQAATQAAAQALAYAGQAVQVARAANAAAAQAEVTAAKARAYAQQWYQYAQGKLAEANYLNSRADSEQAQAEAIWNQISAYEAHGNFRAAEQYSARYGAQADQLASAASADYNTASMDAIAYARLQGWVAKYTQIAAADAAASRDEALAGHLKAAARSLAAAAAAAARKAAAEAAQYRSDLEYYREEQKFAAADHVSLGPGKSEIPRTPSQQSGREILVTPVGQTGPEILVTPVGQTGREVLVTPVGDPGIVIAINVPSGKGLLTEIYPVGGNGPIINYAKQSLGKRILVKTKKGIWAILLGASAVHGAQTGQVIGGQPPKPYVIQIDDPDTQDESGDPPQP